MTQPNPPPDHVVADVVDRALREDLGEAGDLTTDAVFETSDRSRARIVTRRDGVISGLAAAVQVFERLSGAVHVDLFVADGDVVAAGTVLAELDGSTRAILTGERTCLNLLGHLSGIATTTRSVVDAVSGTGAGVADTRKTTPGLRSLEKYAVRCGGGMNHRFGLHDAVMIKDNHVAACGSIRAAVERVRAGVGHTVRIEVEVDRLDQIEEAVNAGADIVLLDNMSPDELTEAVTIVAGRVVTEASGGITPATAAQVAASGVDLLSIGWITHSAPRLDVALDLD